MLKRISATLNEETVKLTRNSGPKPGQFLSSQKISEILPLHSGIIVVLSNK